MVKAEARHIPLYPELRACAAPSAARVLEIFANVSRHHLAIDGKRVNTFQPELTPVQLQVLDLLGIPASAYTGRPGTAARYPPPDVRKERSSATDRPLPR